VNSGASLDSSNPLCHDPPIGSHCKVTTPSGVQGKAPTVHRDFVCSISFRATRGGCPFGFTYAAECCKNLTALGALTIHRSGLEAALSQPALDLVFLEADVRFDPRREYRRLRAPSRRPSVARGGSLPTMPTRFFLASKCLLASLGLLCLQHI